MTQESPLNRRSNTPTDAWTDPVEALVNLLSTLPAPSAKTNTRAPRQDLAPQPVPAPSGDRPSQDLDAVAAQLHPQPAVDRSSPASVPAPLPTDAAGASARRNRNTRVKTTFIGFEPSTRADSDMMSGEAAESAAEEPLAMFPAGWLVIVSGPGRGAGLPVFAGVSQIGRGDDQTVQLNFGDAGISRSNHAVVAYDPERRQFYLGHGGKSNLVRKNGMPVLATEPLEDGDEIRISETVLRFRPLCGPEFCWSTGE